MIINTCVGKSDHHIDVGVSQVCPIFQDSHLVYFQSENQPTFLLINNTVNSGLHKDKAPRC